MLTVKQAAERIKVCPTIVYALVAADVLTHVRVGRPGKRGTIRIAETDLDAYLNSMRHVGNAKRDAEPAAKQKRTKPTFRHIVVR
jgi:excisionase family DNA binding protein